MNYLELVNTAIRESGVDLDELTAGTFASPSDRMHVRFKDWVARGWKELQLERDEWLWTGAQNFRTNQTYEQAGGNIRSNSLNVGATIPTLYTNSTFTTTNLVAGNWIRGKRSGAQARIAGAVLVDNDDSTYASATRPQQGYRAQLYVGAGSGTFYKGENISVWNSTNTSELEATNTFTILDNNGYRLYSRSSELSTSVDLLKPNYDSFQLIPSNLALNFTSGTSPFSASASTQTDEPRKRELRWIEWNDFKALANDQHGSTLDNDNNVGTPRYITRDDSGLYRFFPAFSHRDTTLWDVTFTGKVRLDGLSAHTDVPLLIPEEYHEMIVWRAVMEYADWDNKANVWNRARKKYDFWKRRAEDNLMPPPKWEPNPFYANSGGKR